MTDEGGSTSVDWDDIVAPDQVVAGSVDIAEFVGELGSRMLAHAGLEHWTCEPRESTAPLFRNESMVSLRLRHAPPESGTLELTTRIPIWPQLDLRPLLADLNYALEFDGPSERSFVLIRSEPFDRVALVDSGQRERLASARFLVVEDADRLATGLREAGFEWVFGGVVWPQHFSRAIGRIAALLAVVEEDAPSLSWTADGPGFRLCVSAGRRTLADQWFSGASSLIALLHAINTALEKADCKSRVLHVSGEAALPPRLVVVGPAWASAVVQAAVADRHALEPEWRAVARHPGILPDLVRCPTPTQLVGAANVLEGDFKCSARETDLPLVAQSLLSFGRIGGSVDELARRTHDGYEITLRVGHGTRSITMDGAKYADVRPILDVLNDLLPADTDWRLFAFRAAGYSSGVVRADREQHDELMRWCHVVDPWT